MTTLGRVENAGQRGVVPALAAGSPTAIGADVEAAPVIHRRHHRRRRLGVRSRTKISRRSGRSHTHRREADGTQQKLFHCVISGSFSSSLQSRSVSEIDFYKEYIGVRRQMPSPKCNSRGPSEAPESNDLLRFFGNPGNSRAHQNPLLPCRSVPIPLFPISRTLFTRTKLEHCCRECYMWITGDRQACGIGKRIGSGSRVVPSGSQGDPKAIPESAGPTAGRVVSAVVLRSGERQWREA